jgi:hypothetical protein
MPDISCHKQMSVNDRIVSIHEEEVMTREHFFLIYFCRKSIV